MSNLGSSYFQAGELEALSRQDTIIHRLDPRIKIIITLFFVCCVVSYGKYEVSGLIPYFMFPLVICQVGRVRLTSLAKKVAIVSPFAVFIGIFNPFIDREVFTVISGVSVTGGWVSFLSILVRFMLTVSAALALVAVSGFQAVCLALDRLKVPRVFVLQLLFLHRYIFVLSEEALSMIRAYHFRSAGQGSISFKTAGSMMGHLLLRTLDRAQRIYRAMYARGFQGQIILASNLKIKTFDVLFVLIWVGLFILLRSFNVTRWLGAFMLGVIT